MVCVGINVAKDKHNCFILSSEGRALANVFTIPNSVEGFQSFLEEISSYICPQDSITARLEATGHYSYNLLGFLLDSGLQPYVLNPLHTNLYQKSLSLWKPKTDRVDALPLGLFQFLDCKRQEGKHHHIHMTAAASKFLNIYYGTVMTYLATL